MANPGKSKYGFRASCIAGSQPAPSSSGPVCQPRANEHKVVSVSVSRASASGSSTVPDPSVPRPSTLRRTIPDHNDPNQGCFPRDLGKQAKQRDINNNEHDEDGFGDRISDDEDGQRADDEDDVGHANGADEELDDSDHDRHRSPGSYVHTQY